MHWIEILSYAFVIVVILLIANGAVRAFSIYFTGEHHREPNKK